MKTRLIYLALIYALVVCSCSVEVEQASVTSQAEDTPVISATSAFPVTHIPLTWAHLNLTGNLIYLNSIMEGQQLSSNIQMLDLTTGEIRTIFSVSSAWIYYATISPDAKNVVISYAPPSQAGSPSIRSLYILPVDGSAEPQPLFPPLALADRYTQAEWSPDGKYIYYVHYNQDELSQAQFFEDYDISRMTFPAGEQEQILEHAFWTRVSTDSSRLVYVSLEPESGKNELFTANADGSNSQRVAMSGAHTPEIIDAPLFALEAGTILFSAPEPGQSYRPNFFERMMGIQVAKAHSVPSDWWSVPVTGGTPTRLTSLKTINLFASLSPDQKHIASLSGDGIFVMDLDGSNLTQLLVDPRVHGTVSWIP